MKHSALFSEMQMKAVASSGQYQIMRLVSPLSIVAMQDVSSEEAEKINLFCTRLRVPVPQWEPPIPSKADRKAEQEKTESEKTEPGQPEKSGKPDGSPL